MQRPDELLISKPLIVWLLTFSSTMGDELVYEPLYVEPCPKEKWWNRNMNIVISRMYLFIRLFIFLIVVAWNSQWTWPLVLMHVWMLVSHRKIICNWQPKIHIQMCISGSKCFVAIYYTHVALAPEDCPTSNF